MTTFSLNTRWEMGVVVLNEKWHAECAGRCLDNNPIMTQCLQYAKDNDPSEWGNQMEKCTFACERRTAKGGGWEPDRWADLKSSTQGSDSGVCVYMCVCVSVPLCVILHCVSAPAHAMCRHVGFYVCLCTCACVCMLLRRVDRVQPGMVRMLAYTLCLH